MIENIRPQFPVNIQWALRRLSLFNEGRRDAIQFAWDCEGQISQIEERLREKEGQLEDVFLLQGPLKPNASPRFYHEGYIKGLYEVMEVIVQAISENKEGDGE